jgi:hypothetical protein
MGGNIKGKLKAFKQTIEKMGGPENQNGFPFLK